MNGHKHIYSIAAGRIILMDGKRFVVIQRLENTTPVDADNFTKELIEAMNGKE